MDRKTFKKKNLFSIKMVELPLPSMETLHQDIKWILSFLGFGKKKQNEWPAFELLSLFYTNADRPISVKEVCEATGMEKRLVYYYLSKFLYLGLLTREGKYYSLNRAFPIEFEANVRKLLYKMKVVFEDSIKKATLQKHAKNLFNYKKSNKKVVIENMLRR